MKNESLDEITVDILMPTYNGEKYLEEQIKSILEQKHKNIRLIISDDASKDKTKQILKKYETDERITIYYQEKNLGLIGNINFLLSKVNSKYFMLSDQDDVWLPFKVDASLLFAYENGYDLVFSDLKVVDENLDEIYPSFNDYMLLTRKLKLFMAGKIDKKDLNYLYNVVTGCTILANKDMLTNILPIPNFSKHYIHDYHISTVISNCGNVGYLNQKTILYRQHSSNTIGTQKVTHNFKTFDEVRNHFIKVKQGIFGSYCQINIFDESYSKLNKMAYNYYLKLEDVKYLTFKGTSIFNKLYKNETLKYKLENYLILQMPIFARVLFGIRYSILKILGKRK